MNSQHCQTCNIYFDFLFCCCYSFFLLLLLIAVNSSVAYSLLH